MKHKTNNPDRIGFKDCLGTTSLSTISAMSGVLMSTLFMQYMTDYAGLGAMGATLATTLLFAARIVDAVDDPIQGFIMDSGKKTRIGKYKIRCWLSSGWYSFIWFMISEVPSTRTTCCSEPCPTT